MAGTTVLCVVFVIQQSAITLINNPDIKNLMDDRLF